MFESVLMWGSWVVLLGATLFACFIYKSQATEKEKRKYVELIRTDGALGFAIEPRKFYSFCKNPNFNFFSHANNPSADFANDFDFKIHVKNILLFQLILTRSSCFERKKNQQNKNAFQ